jgi:ubiquinol-cytochrome c reductase cytochrome b/c1 subunit
VFLPWLDTLKVRSSRYRPLAKRFFWAFVVVCILLGWLGGKPAEGVYTALARVLTAAYFAYFLIVLPVLSRMEKTLPLPNSIADDVLARSSGKAVASIAVIAALAGSLVVGGTQTAKAAGGENVPASLSWSFAGPFGTYDRAQLQRGFKIYKEVCSACHSLNLIAYRNLTDPGGPGFSKEQAEALAAEATIKDGPNDSGEMFDRPRRIADRFPAPFANEQAARFANGGAAPPDLSLMAKARSYERGFPQFVFDFFTQFQEQGPNYIAALLKGYEDTPPEGFSLPDGSFYNKYFPGHSIKMPPPLSEGQVSYDDGSPQTMDQYTKDIATFLMWAAEPHMEARKRMGLQVMIFLLLLSGLLYFTKQKVWADAH